MSQGRVQRYRRQRAFQVQRVRAQRRQFHRLPQPRPGPGPGVGVPLLSCGLVSRVDIGRSLVWRRLQLVWRIFINLPRALVMVQGLARRGGGGDLAALRVGCLL